MHHAEVIFILPLSLRNVFTNYNPFTDSVEVTNFTLCCLTFDAEKLMLEGDLFSFAELSGCPWYVLD